jgi:type III restriction enzyme
MTQSFFDDPILNTPYDRPGRHWELSESGQPTNVILASRRPSNLVTPIPPPKKKKKGSVQLDMLETASAKPDFNPTAQINDIRSAVESWRNLPESQWAVSPTTARLLRHWRSHEFANQRPFFCQVEAIETVIWMTEVAPRTSSQGRRFWTFLEAANAASNPDVLRMAMKLATGAGKTTVMAMLIAWQTLNAVRHPGSRNFTRGFLIIAPGLTIRERLRVLQPNDPDSYYKSREIVPEDMLVDLGKARIVITNYHAFKRKAEVPLNKVQQAALKTEERPESDGAMTNRIAGELMGIRNICVINDEAHHCYRERVADEDEKLIGDDLDDAKKNNEAARLWISGIEAVRRTLGVRMVYDLSATPFFLKGSGYPEGSLFGWTVSDFNLMDAIECGIVKLPRVPIVDNVPSTETPMFRNLWEHVGKHLPKKGRSKSGGLNPQQLPPELLSAIDALYGHYQATRELWIEAGLPVDPVFIVVCNNTTTSKLVYDYISGYEITGPDGSVQQIAGHCELFQNFDPNGYESPQLRTLLIDSEQIDSGEGISKEFREAAADEIERFRKELIQRTGDAQAAQRITDEQLLREVMNTVGRPGQLGGGVRCVVSVSMLTEGWDANTVTHVLGLRAFGTQLLCEQVIGRALRRQSYQAKSDGRFEPEYADIFGIPFDFTAQAVPARPRPPSKMVHVHAVSPERDALEIRFPRVEGYRTDLPQDVLRANFDENSKLRIDPDLVGASETVNQGIVGETVDMTLKHLADKRASSILLTLTDRILKRHFTEGDEPPPTHLIMPLKRIVREWMDNHLTCVGQTFPAQVLYPMISEMAGERIKSAIVRASVDTGRVRVLLDPFNREGSTRHVNFHTSADCFATDPAKCHVNYCVLDSDWEGAFCAVVEKNPRVICYVKNHGLGFEVPYAFKGEVRRYRPDFILRIDDGHGPEDPLNLVVEIKGYRGEDAKEKASTMQTYWVPGVNALGRFGRWAFAEFTDVWTMKSDLEGVMETFLQRATQRVEHV